LKNYFRELCEVCLQQNISVKEAAEVNWKLNFRRCLDENQRNQQNRMSDITYPLGEGNDKPLWKLNDKKIFTFKSMYK
jgi:hypothetical protein